MATSIVKIVSGGQTGADMGGLLAAKFLKIPTGGWAPRGFRTERGSHVALGTAYGLIEHPSSYYAPRTEANIHLADGTVLFGDMSSAGSHLTISLCQKLGSPYLTNPDEAALKAFIITHHAITLNIAGNRESVSPGIQERVRKFLIQALSQP